VLPGGAVVVVVVVVGGAVVVVVVVVVLVVVVGRGGGFFAHAGVTNNVTSTHVDRSASRATFRSTAAFHHIAPGSPTRSPHDEWDDLSFFTLMGAMVGLGGLVVAMARIS
jgi:hypothetical protein